MNTQELLGNWHIIFTNFPMWLKGDKTAPQFSYRATRKNDKILDVVSYQQSGKRREIRGTDRQIAPSKFVWRGSGILFLFSSKWAIEHLDESKQWAIISFEKSLVSPSGYDIICRTANPDYAAIGKMIATFGKIHPGIPLTLLTAR